MFRTTFHLWVKCWKAGSFALCLGKIAICGFQSMGMKIVNSSADQLICCFTETWHIGVHFTQKWHCEDASFLNIFSVKVIQWQISKLRDIQLQRKIAERTHARCSWDMMRSKVWILSFHRKKELNELDLNWLRKLDFGGPCLCGRQMQSFFKSQNI